MSFAHLPADPEAAAAVSVLSGELRRIVIDTPQAAHSIHNSAIDRAPAKLYAIADDLCGRGDFRNALPIAIHLLARPDAEPHHAYLAASCLQRMGQPALAVGVFGFCTMLEGDDPTPGPLFRAGECLAALGARDKALEALDLAIELAREDAEHAAVQSLAQAKADTLRMSH